MQEKLEKYFSVGDNQSFRILNRDEMISNPNIVLFFLDFPTDF